MRRQLTSLMSDPKAFSRMHIQLSTRAVKQLASILEFEPELSDEQLPEVLALALKLEPLELDPLHSINIKLEPTDEIFGRGLFAHQARLPYRGSRGLWSVKPKGPWVEVVGRAAEGSVTIENWYQTKRFDDFEDHANLVVEGFRRVIPEQLPDIIAFNAGLPEAAVGFVRGGFEEIAKFRRRGRQLQEREQRRLALDAAEEPIEPIYSEWQRLVRNLIREERRHAT